MAIARLALRPTVQAALTLKEYDKKFGDLKLPVLIEALLEQTKASNNGELSRAEAMMTTQAHTLDAIFNNLARRAINADYLNQVDTYLKLALRAQSQCRLFAFHIKQFKQGINTHNKTNCEKHGAN